MYVLLKLSRLMGAKPKLPRANTALALGWSLATWSTRGRPPRRMAHGEIHLAFDLHPSDTSLLNALMLNSHGQFT